MIPAPAGITQDRPSFGKAGAEIVAVVPYLAAALRGINRRLRSRASIR
jgi:hypothetical protein